MLQLYLGVDPVSATNPAGRAGRVGAAASGVFLLVVAGLMFLLSSLGPAPSIALGALGAFILAFALRSNLTRSRANTIALIGHLCALFAFYIFYTRMLNVTYVTDSIAGTYLGIVKVLQLQNPYLFSIKSVLDQLGFPPSLYTPHVDGSFEFHLNYPAMNFLAMIPAYLAGLHDIRDGVMIFHVASLLLIFAVVPARFKALSLVPFSLGFPLLIGYSWTDSVWAFFTLLTAVTWRENRTVSLFSFGLAVATKQIAIVAAPFLLIRAWNETQGPKFRSILKTVSIPLVGFFLPNIPFIISSPSAWWMATVGPYLPSSSPLVPSGIGLSEILPDIGLGLSPVYFNIMVAAATVGSVSLFLWRYRRLNGFLWVMPMLVLFFYSRSFPNYIIYWMFPFIFEWFTFGNPSLNISRVLALFHLRGNGTGLNPLGVLRKRVWPVMMVLIVLVTVLVGASGTSIAPVTKPRLEIKLVGMKDPDNLGVATMLYATLTNHAQITVHPRFFVKWFFLWDVWMSNSSQGLATSSASTYQINATDALAGIPPGNSFRIAAYDSVSGAFLGQSELYSSIVSRPRLANPRFEWWTLDLSTGQQTPFPWKLTTSGVDRDQAGIAVANATTSSGLRLWINSVSSTSAIRSVEVSQKLLFNETLLSMRFFFDASGWSTGCAFGIEASDGVRSLDYVLSPVTSQMIVSSSGSNTTVTLPADESTPQSVSLDIASLWFGQGWTAPSLLSVALFLRADASVSCSAETFQLSSV